MTEHILTTDALSSNVHVFASQRLDHCSRECVPQLQDEVVAVSPAADKEWAAALLRIKHRDPALYDGATHFFPAQRGAGTSSAAAAHALADGAAHDGSAGKERKRTLRQLQYEQVHSRCLRAKFKCLSCLLWSR